VRGRVHEAIDGAPDPVRWFVFDAEGLSHVDATGIGALKQLILSLRDDGIVFVVARLKGPVERTFEDVGLLEVIGEQHVYPTVRDAVDAAGVVRTRPHSRG
jgi:SulP family sulfate permease